MPGDCGRPMYYCACLRTFFQHSIRAGYGLSSLRRPAHAVDPCFQWFRELQASTTPSNLIQQERFKKAVELLWMDMWCARAAWYDMVRGRVRTAAPPLFCKIDECFVSSGVERLSLSSHLCNIRGHERAAWAGLLKLNRPYLHRLHARIRTEPARPLQPGRSGERQRVI